MSRCYQIAFCGLGSIGTRHFQNLRQYMAQSGFACQIDLIRSAPGKPLPPAIAPHVRRQYSYEDAIPDTYDVIFVTNPTAMHWDTLRRYHKNTRSLFVEKPIFDSASLSLPEISALLYVACPIRYTSVFQYIREHVDYARAYCARAISSSYLPDWRPGVDYRQVYSAHKDMGGGVAIDLIHEWDYLTALFGFPQKVHAVMGTYSSLEIDSEDLAVYIGEYPQRLVEVHLDYFGRKSMRKLELFLPEDSVTADFVERTVTLGRTGKIISLPEQRDHYQMGEIRHFFDILEGKTVNDSTAGDALRVLQLAIGNGKERGVQ